MKRFLFTILTAVLSTMACSQVTSPISIQNEKYDMGKIVYGKSVEYVVTITNNTADTLTLESAKAGCGCTTPSFVPNQKFGPNQSVAITIRFNGSVMGKFVRYTDIYLSGGIVKQVSFTGEGVQDSTVQKSGIK